MPEPQQPFDPEPIFNKTMRNSPGVPGPNPEQEGFIKSVIKQVSDNAHIHRWGIIGMWAPEPRPVHPRDVSLPYAVVLIKCRECGIPRTVNLDGIWTAEQIMRKPDDNTAADIWAEEH